MYDKIKPITGPKAITLIAIKTASGKNGKIDSSTTIKEPINKLINILLFKTKF